MILFWRGDHIVLGTTLPLVGFPRVYLSPKEQRYHATIWGKSGQGKSKQLQSIFLQHYAKGNGVGLVEPHHDLSFDILTSLVAQGCFRGKASGYHRLVYVDWGNGEYVPFNILADDGRSDPHSRSLNALEAMVRVWPSLAEAPMFQELFLASILTLIANNLPITFIYRLLSDAEFRRACLIKISDQLVLNVFASYDKLGRDQVHEAGSTLRRAFLLGFSPAARFTLGQPHNWLPFRKWMDEGTSFILNLGNVNDQQTKRLLGAMLMVQIEQAALSRTDLAPSERRPFTMMVDEWPSFAAQDDTIGTILSQSRKFNLTLYLAAQSLSQVSSQRLAGALENCRLTMVFGLGRDSAEIQAKQIGFADPMLIKEEQFTPTQHNQYLTVLEQFESWTQELQNLSPQTCYVKLADKQAVRIRTPHVPNRKVDPGELAAVLARYRELYQRNQSEAEAAANGAAVPGIQVPGDGLLSGNSGLFRSGEGEYGPLPK